MLTTAENSQVATVSRDSIMQIQSMMMAMPQAPGMDTNHYFAGGMYCRKMLIPAGHVIVGKTHKSEHFFIGCAGVLMVAGQGENYILNPGDVIVSPIGTKRAITALTDVIAMTIHKTDITTIDDLEAELVEDELSMFDVNNQPKASASLALGNGE